MSYGTTGIRRYPSAVRSNGRITGGYLIEHHALTITLASPPQSIRQS
ncbi:hypothetical protein D805_0186 [Bifidobacterium thermophilum RBL67]|uniref:Uncharacterized protein n=1 Tax=Bifidobacterium thermophilum RBL67 TaxID=1254439 RepID=M4RD66_9BIFI|nr:hypothetical protein D805_0186 [Bifidobacterium thermophilum RBL67]